jgi:hypothetical protein
MINNDEDDINQLFVQEKKIAADKPKTTQINDYFGDQKLKGLAV